MCSIYLLWGWVECLGSKGVGSSLAWAPPSLPSFVTYKPKEHDLCASVLCALCGKENVPFFDRATEREKETGLGSGFCLLGTLPIKARALGPSSSDGG